MIRLSNGRLAVDGPVEERPDGTLTMKVVTRDRKRKRRPMSTAERQLFAGGTATRTRLLFADEDWWRHR